MNPIEPKKTGGVSLHRVFVSGGMLENIYGVVLWFSNLHLVINEQGEILDVELTPGNTDDRRPLPKFAEGLHGNLYADRGYISKDLREQLRAQGINLVYKVRNEHETPGLIRFAKADAYLNR